MANSELALRIEAVAKALCGEPNKRQSAKDELRFGTNGSLRVSIAGEHRGTWTDHETGESGGVLDLIVHKQGGDHKSAAAWLRENIEGSGAANDAGQIVAVYRYEDWAGDLVHEVVRYEPKNFRQRRPDGKGGHLWNMKGVGPTLYNLPRVHEAAMEGERVIVVEGEKDADRLNRLGLVATCNAGGAGKWKPEHSGQLSGARVAIIPDNDDAGRDHAEQVAAAMREHSPEIKVVPLDISERKGDVCTWLDAGGNVEELCAKIQSAPDWRPTFRPRFPVVWFGREDEAAPMRWLVRGLLVEGGLSVVYGAPKSTKTFAALDLALHIAHDRDWYGLKSRGAGVAYICGEGAAGVRQRMKAWRQERDGEATAPFALIPQSIDLFGDPDELDRLIADLDGMALPMGQRVGLVVLDTLSRMIGGGDEDKARDVNVVVRSAERIQRLTGAHVMIVHHTGSNNFARKFLENGAQPSGFIKSPASLSTEQVENLRYQLNERHVGTTNAGRIAILNSGLEWQQVQISPEDAELLESRKFGVEEICRLFQVPPPLVQDYSHNTFTNSETAGRWFAMFTLAPWARKIEAEFARSVFPSTGAYELELDLSGFLRGDPATRWNAHKIAIDTGVLDPDEVRQVEGWNPRSNPAPGLVV